MSDEEFGTVNVRRGDRGREIEILRQHYRHHRETLVALSGDAPTEHLAGEYGRLVHDIDESLRKLEELEGRVPSDTQPVIRTDGGARPSTAAGVAAAAASEDAFRRRQTEPGRRPLVNGPAEAAAVEGESPNQTSRLVLIVLAGIVVLAIIGWLLWRASADRRQAGVIQERTETAVPATIPADTVAPIPPVPVEAALTIAPAAQDYGTIRKGTRAVRQFQVTNTTSEPLTVQVTRSACRCLYYDYIDKLAPGKKETITVTVDGAKAKSGALHETLSVSSKKDPSVTAQFAVNAEIK